MDTNSNPVLSRMVKGVLSDLAKVVIDTRKNKIADIGEFIHVHKGRHEIHRPKNNMQTHLKIDGFKVHLNFPSLEIISNKKSNMPAVYNA